MNINIFVKTNKKVNQAYWEVEGLFQMKDKLLIIETKEPPLNGKANLSIIEIVAEFFDTTKSKVSIKSGFTSKYKVITVNN